MLARFLCVLSLQLAAAKVKVCANSAKLTRCDGQTPYGWDAFPHIVITDSFGGGKICDGDPLNPAATRYVKTDDSTPQWNMCCEMEGDSLLHAEVRVIDHETLKNMEIGSVNFGKDEDDLPALGTEKTFTKQMTAPSTSFVEFLFMGTLQIPTQFQKSFTNCETGTVEVSISVYDDAAASAPAAPVSTSITSAPIAPVSTSITSASLNSASEDCVFYINRKCISRGPASLVAQASAVIKGSGNFPVVALAVLVVVGVGLRSSKKAKTPEQPANDPAPLMV